MKITTQRSWKAEWKNYGEFTVEYDGGDHEIVLTQQDAGDMRIHPSDLDELIFALQSCREVYETNLESAKE